MLGASRVLAASRNPWGTRWLKEVSKCVQIAKLRLVVGALEARCLLTALAKKAIIAPYVAMMPGRT